MPEYPSVFFSHESLPTGGKYGIGSLGANNAKRFGGKYWVIFKPEKKDLFSLNTLAYLNYLN